MRCLSALILSAVVCAAAPVADTVLLGGKILILDSKQQSSQALAIRDRHIIAFGTDQQIRAYIGKQTKVMQLAGKTVIPGLIESHVHSIGVTREEHDQPYAALSSIAEIQSWIRKRAAELPAGAW